MRIRHHPLLLSGWARITVYSVLSTGYWLPKYAVLSTHRLLVAARVRLVPAPGGLDDRLEIEPRPPAEHLARARGVGNQLRRVARAAGADLGGDRSAGDLAAGFDHLLHA